MSITVSVHKSLIIDAASNKKKAWQFESGNWRCTYSGSFKQACVVAKKIYAKSFRCSYGQLLVTSAGELETDQQIGFKF